MPIQASPHTSQLLKLSDRPMEGDSDTEMADYGTDFSDDVDPNFDAKARPQQGSIVEIRSDFRPGPLLVSLRSRGRQMTAACSLSRTLNRSRMLPVRALA